MNAWNKEDYLSIWQRVIHSMQDVDHWNVLLFLPDREDIKEVRNGCNSRVKQLMFWTYHMFLHLNAKKRPRSKR